VFFSFSLVVPGKHLYSTLKHAITTSFYIHSNASFMSFPVQHCIENNENLADRMSTDNERLWEVIKIFEYLKNTQPTFYHSTQNLPVNDI
jgi:hypothetical protein